jgi:hypothetical protein
LTDHGGVERMRDSEDSGRGGGVEASGDREGDRGRSVANLCEHFDAELVALLDRSEVYLGVCAPEDLYELFVPDRERVARSAGRKGGCSSMLRLRSAG